MTATRVFEKLAEQAASLGLRLGYDPGAGSPYRLVASTDRGPAYPVAFKTRAGVARYLDELAWNRDAGVPNPEADDAGEAGGDSRSNEDIDAAIRAGIVRLGDDRLIDLLQETGHAVVYLDGDDIVHEHPDGTREVVGHIGDDTATPPATPPP